MVFFGIQLALSLIAAIAAIFALLWAHRAAREGRAMRSLLERLHPHERVLVAAPRIDAPPRISTEIEHDPETPLVLSSRALDELELMAERSGRSLDEMLELMIVRALDKLERDPERMRQFEVFLRRLQAFDDEQDSEVQEQDASDET